MFAPCIKSIKALIYYSSWYTLL